MTGFVFLSQGRDFMNINDFPIPHIPSKLPIADVVSKILTDADFMRLTFRATSQLSEFIGYLQNLPNPSILISALTLQESVLSSRIEGTLATISDVVRDDTDSKTLKDDIVEIENYVKAIDFGSDELVDREYRISKNLICTLHSILLTNNVRGANKSPGSFKTEQNYIRNDILGNFTPLPPYLTDEYIENLTEYLNSTHEVSPLIQAAIMHAQFEMIHPFKDGNGRVGRLLIPLFLFSQKAIPFPTFYISRYFAEYDTKYKKCLFDISKTVPNDSVMLTNTWKQWLTFFMNGVIRESANHIETSKKIIALYDTMRQSLRRTDQYPIVDYFFDNLRLEPKEFLKEHSISRSTVYSTLHTLEENEYIVRTGSERKSKYVFQKLVDIM